MAHDPEHRRRRSIRLKGYDYSQPGAYFVTVCTQDRACLFGTVVDEEMRSNDAGRMVERWWGALNRKFPHIRTDAFVVMPNHVHGIIVIESVAEPGGADLSARPRSNAGAARHSEGADTGAPLQEIVRWFKTITTNDYIRGVEQLRWPAFRRRLWQRNFYEHVIRSETSLERIREYILTNPLRWHLDRENPDRTGKDEAWEVLFGTARVRRGRG